VATDLRLVDLFAGAGGASIGAKRAGFRLVAAVEWNADACATHRVTLPDCPVFEGDVRDFEPPAAEVWWASPPCQPFSKAGKRKGAADDRNGWPWLWDAYDRAVHKPHTIVCENVVGSLHHTKKPGRCGSPSKCAGCYWEQKVLEAARARFAHVDYRVLNCADFGVPQARRRVILVCSDKPYTWPTPTHGPTTDQPWVSMGEALGARCVSVATAHSSGVPMSERRLVDLTDRPSLTIGARMGMGSGIPFVMDGMRNTPQNPRQERVRGSDEPAPTIGTKGNAIISVGILDRPAPTVDTCEIKGQTVMVGGKLRRVNRASDALFLGTGRRRLTIEECAILQDLEGVDFQGKTKKSRYAQVGNAVPPRLAEVVLRPLAS